MASIIASTLHGRVELEIGRERRAGPREVTSYEHVLRGIRLFRTLTVAGNAAAAECFKTAIDVDPSNAYAHRWLSSCHLNYWFIHHGRGDLQKGLDLARRAIELDPANALCFTAYGILQIWAEGLDAAAATYRKALALNPGDPHIHAELGLLQAYEGDIAGAHDCFDRAERLNPLSPLWYAEFRGIAAFAEGRYAEAVPGFAAVPECAFDNCYVMACLGHLEDRAGIAAVLPRIREQNWDLLAVAAAEPFRDPERKQRLIDGVAKALALAKT